ncbi:beta-1 3-galactosyl-O-glycosyl-glycoprotein beta-1 6-N-acetylglucosaminyltransferase [Biomphalaria pfeifferi]|uniref:Beta-1 3-galactosyl-O-glycosyl-glycoprotein beta-1 6-N-acetylglucosaminyltransferase n=1 Tax=Biomphalaria pfeifferi TaxID=112525 RepID=A0AAD8F7D8_BIOPF|nr:beta-1 3-galactosyl-O-glycosyl-glycoprotein beta-1 6-N-acetylglucosaminyltransferase [Biomphalaria pfeifferi]
MFNLHYKNCLTARCLLKKFKILFYVQSVLLCTYVIYSGLWALSPSPSDYRNLRALPLSQEIDTRVKAMDLIKFLSSSSLGENWQVSGIDVNRQLNGKDIRNIFNVLSSADRQEEKRTPSNSGLGDQRYISASASCSLRNIETIQAIYKVSDVNCKQIFAGDQNATSYATRRIKKTKKQLLSNEFYLNLSENCENFKAQRGYVLCPLHSEEEHFPIAFSLLVYKDIEMVERLLRLIYRPQNYYCVHVDKKAEPGFLSAISAISQCFQNVFIAPERVDVQWGTFSVLEPEFVCMKELWRYKKWKYFINLTGQEFPLKTNWELVQILKAYRGANDIEGTVKRVKKSKWTSKPPFNLTAVKGSVHIAANRDFVDFILHNKQIKTILAWVNTSRIPDETLFATLNHNPQLGIRGTYRGVPETENSTSLVKPYLTRFKNWRGPPHDFPCAGHFYHGICILSTGDLPLLGSAKQMFANKFYLSEDSTVVSCLEELLFNRTRDETKGINQFNSNYYSQLGFVWNQVP